MRLLSLVMPVNQEGPKMGANVNDRDKVAKNRPDAAEIQKNLWRIRPVTVRSSAQLSAARG
jgi:hypothetical protein